MVTSDTVFAGSWKRAAVDQKNTFPGKGFALFYCDVCTNIIFSIVLCHIDPLLGNDSEINSCATATVK
jgi:hypothetical protein